MNEISRNSSGNLDENNWGGYGCVYTGRFMMFSVITNIYNKKTKRPTLMEFFTATGKVKKIFFDN